MTTHPPPVDGAVLEPLPDERERGLPSVNAPGRAARWARGLVYGLLVLGLPLTGVALISHYGRDAADPTPPQKSMPLTSTVPARTFNLPAPAAPPPPPAVVTPPPTPVVSAAPAVPLPLPPPIAAPPPVRPAGQIPPPRPPPVLDKSDGALMIEAGASPAAVAATAAPATGQDTTLSGLLTATATPPRSASLLPDRDYLLTKGAFIECVLETRLDSTVPGMTRCRVTRPIYSDTGRVVLIDRGSTVSGEYQATMRQGMARIFVLWTRLKTPSGVVVSLDSPATDALGGSGIPGEVDTHFWQRFGGALLLSLVDDAVAAAAAAAARSGDGQTMINFGGTSDTAQTMAAEALRNTINIPPTLYTNQGARVGIYVARDLSFKAVYELQTSGQSDDYQ